MDISGSNQSATWSLQVFRNSEVTPLYESEQIFSTTSGGSGTQDLSIQLVYSSTTVYTGDVITITNNTNANAINISSVGGQDTYWTYKISVPSDGTPVNVQFSISKITPVNYARANGLTSLIIGSSVLSQFGYNALSQLSGTLTSNINNGDTVTITITD